MKRRLSLLLFLAILLTACAAAPSETATARPTETPTSEPTSAPTKTVSVSEIFKASPDFYKALSSQDKEASKHFSVENGKTYLLIGNQKFEVDPSSAAVNVDVNGNPLLVENTGYKDPITIRGVGKEANQVFAFAPQTKINLEEGKEKVFPAHWFEVIQTNHTVDQNASFEEQMKQREIAINDPIKVTVDQVQNGEWAMSVLLSGLLKPFPDNWKFTGNALYHNSNEGGIAKNLDWTLLYTSKPIQIDMYGIVNLPGNNIGLFPEQIWNPQNLQNPDRRQILIANNGQGQERLTPEQIKIYLENIYQKNKTPTLIVSAPDDFLSSIKELGLDARPSILSLTQLPGNDPGLVFKSTIENIVSRVDNPNLWQAGPFYLDPQRWNIQNLIWLSHIK